MKKTVITLAYILLVQLSITCGDTAEALHPLYMMEPWAIQSKNLILFTLKLLINRTSLILICYK